MKMEIWAVVFSFILFALYVLLPMIPAILIYRLFPDTKVGVRGPLGALTISASGAFAAYIVTVLLGYFLINSIHQQIKDIAHPTWAIIGYVNKKEGGDQDNITVKQLPPSPTDTTDKGGEFRLQGVDIVPSEGKIQAEIKVNSPGYVPKSFLINEQNADISEAKREIRVKETIILEKAF
jgi:hypothetical protein